MKLTSTAAAMLEGGWYCARTSFTRQNLINAYRTLHLRLRAGAGHLCTMGMYVVKSGWPTFVSCVSANQKVQYPAYFLFFTISDDSRSFTISIVEFYTSRISAEYLINLSELGRIYVLLFLRLSSSLLQHAPLINDTLADGSRLSTCAISAKISKSNGNYTGLNRVSRLQLRLILWRKTIPQRERAKCHR